MASRSVLGKRLNWAEHCLKRPDTFIGSVVNQTLNTYILENNVFVKKTIRYNPGLFNIFREIGVNAIDNKWASDDAGITMKYINFDLDTNSGQISVENDGAHIDVKKIPYEYKDPITQEITTTKMYPAEFFFGYEKTSTNYDDTEDRKNAGRNGLGSKATNAFSKLFRVEHGDPVNEKQLKIEFTDNCTKRTVPKVKDYKKKTSFTRVTFIPDYERFNYVGEPSLDEDLISLIQKFAIDCAVLSGMKVTFTVDGVSTVYKISSFEKYVKMYFPGCKMIDFTVGQNTAILVDTSELLPNEQEMNSVSFVNGLSTLKGGVHVNAWKETILKPLVVEYNKTRKTKKGATTPITTSSAKMGKYLSLFVFAEVANPAFDSQTKDCLNSPAPPTIKPVDSDISKILKWPFVEMMTDQLLSDEDRKLSRKETVGRRVIFGPKVNDANKAGTKEAHLCTLFITEGDSAKGTAIGIISKLKNGHDYYGALAIRGKFLNVTKATKLQISENAEVQMLQAVLGVIPYTDYSLLENRKKLRYGGVNLFTDADDDGIHIRALLANFFFERYPQLYEEGYFQISAEYTPVVRVWKSNKDKRLKKPSLFDFYNISDYLDWTNEKIPHYPHYYKGLGSIEAGDTQHIAENRRIVNYVLDKHAPESFKLAFNPKESNRRKEWMIGNRTPDEPFIPDKIKFVTEGKLKLSVFLNKQLVLYELASLIRAIPNMCDGLKEGQRKIIYTMLAKNIVKESKISQLSGSVNEFAVYHHGETSLQETFIGLAQSFVGKNNIRLLYPAGQFGTRHEGGADAAASRYLFTFVENIAKILFDERDFELYERAKEDNVLLEPSWYCPILPLILINGANGIATGFSTNIPNFNPIDIINYVRNFVSGGSKTIKLTPWYFGFKGTIEPVDNSDNSWVTTGILTQLEKNKKGTWWEITELPVGLWTDKMKVYLESLMVKSKDKKNDVCILELQEYHGSNSVHFKFLATKDFTPDVRTKNNMSILQSKISATNICALNKNGYPVRYSSAEELLDDWCEVRLKLYSKRKKYILKGLESDLLKETSRHRFILAIVDKKINMRKLNDDELHEKLEEMGLPKLSTGDGEPSYNYLLNMQIRSLTAIKLLELEKLIKKIESDIEYYTNSTPRDLWLVDISEFEAEYKKYCIQVEKELK